MGEGEDKLIGLVVESRYRVDQVLGAGGMGVVYAVTEVEGGRPLAMKAFRSTEEPNERSRERFLREAEIAASIGNEHIIEILGTGSLPDGRAYYVMERLGGQDLFDLISEAESPIEEERVVHIAWQLCEALEAAHKAGVVHRDLKPENVLLTKVGENRDFVKILDFGVAKVIHEAKPLTDRGELVGTPTYIAPEQCLGEEVDRRADLYALGVLMYELLSGGRLPFESEDLTELIRLKVETDPAPLSERSPFPVEPTLEAVVMKCLARDPKDRYRSARQVIHDLGEVELSAGGPSRASLIFAVAGGPPPAREEAGPAQAPSPAEEERPARGVNPYGLIALILTTLLALAAMIAGVMLLGGE